MSPTPDPTPKRKRPIVLTVVGLLTIITLLVMPFLFGEPDGDKMPDIVRFFGHFHPVLLHLPIGIFALILIQEFLAMFSKKERGDTVLPMFFAAGSAVMAAVLGFLLYLGGGFEGSELVNDHLWGGLYFASAAILTFLVKLWKPVGVASQIPFRLSLLATVGVMGYASHDGASITHGSDYLTEYAPDPIREVLGLDPRKKADEKIEKKPLEELLVYDEIIQPIFNQRCVECHKVDKSKGKFRMDTFEMLVEGGKEGEAIEPGNALDSNIVFRAELPTDDEEHMPPEGKNDILDHELLLVKWWIDEGADPKKTAGELQITDDIRTAFSLLEDAPGTAMIEEPDNVLRAIVAGLEEEFPKMISYSSEDSDDLVFNGLPMRNKLTDEEFEKLIPVIPNFVSVDLSATAVSDRSLALLKKAETLRTLRLSETGITDSSLEIVSELKSLESVNLSGTNVTTEGMKKLSRLPDLKTIYLWQSPVSEEAIAGLKKSFPAVELITSL